MKKDSLPQLFRAILWLSLLPFTGTLRGQTLFENGRLQQNAGFGQFLARTAPLPPLGGAAR